MDIEAELLQLKRRVDDLEGAINVLTEQVRAVHPEVLALKNEAIRRFDAADGQMDRVLKRLDTVNAQVWSLRDDLPVLLRKALADNSGC